MALTLETTTRFKKLYKALPDKIKDKVKRQISLLTQDVRHPSLKAKKMVNRPDVWEARVDLHYRLTFHLTDRTLTLRAVGTHEIYRKP